MILISQPTIIQLVRLAKSQGGRTPIFVQVARHLEGDSQISGLEHNALYLTVSTAIDSGVETVLAYRSPLIRWESFRGELDHTDRFQNVQQLMDAADRLLEDVMSLILSKDCTVHEGLITIPADLLKTFCEGRRFAKWDKETHQFLTFEEGDD